MPEAAMLVAGETCNADVGGGMMPTPVGRAPTGIGVPTNVLVAVSITDTLLEVSFAT
jgi:hypothetical protein